MTSLQEPQHDPKTEDDQPTVQVELIRNLDEPSDVDLDDGFWNSGPTHLWFGSAQK